jgi:MFS superfamily sulfate permease-like transporter
MESASVPSQSERRLSIAEKIGNNLTPWRVLKFVLAATSIALALGWARYVAHGYVYLPAFPDYIDVTLGVCIGVFLFVDYFRELRK